MHGSLSQRRSLTTPPGLHVHPHQHHRRHSHRPISAPFQGAAAAASDADQDQDDEMNAVSEQSRLLSKVHDSPIHRKSDHEKEWPATKPSSLTSQGKTRSSHHGLSSSSGSVAPRSPSPLENLFLSAGFGAEAAARRLQVPLERKGSYVVQRSPRRLERTPSIPAVLISRVKERIHERMLQTSKWPNLVALVQERRQKAASEYLQSRQTIARRSWQVGRAGRPDVVAWEEIPLGEAIALAVPGGGDRGRRMRMKSDPVPEAVASVVRQRQDRAAAATEARKASFRRRSVSSDETCIRGDDSGGGQTSTEGEEEGAERSSVSASPSSGGGIVCSREDFQAILMDHRKRASDPLNRAAEFVRSPTTGRWLETTGGGGFGGGGEGMVHSRSAQSVIGHSSSSQREFALDCHRKTSVCIVAKDNASRPVVSFTSSPTSCVTMQRDASAAKLQAPTETAQLVDCVAEQQTISEPPEPVSVAQATALPETGPDNSDRTGDVCPSEFDPEILGEAIQVHLEQSISRKKKERSDKEFKKCSHVVEAENATDSLLLGTETLAKKRLGDSSPSSSYKDSVCHRDQRPQDGESNILRLLCSFVRKRHAERAS